jgi:hypothetical protein
MAINLTQCQRIVARDNKRFRILVAGRRFGKTYLAIRELAHAAKEPDKTVWYVAPTYRMAKQIVWKPLKEILIGLKWVAKKDESDLRLDLVNGSSICLRGADNPDSLRGASLSFVVLDEFADIPANAFEEVLRPALADQQGGAIFLGTPKGTGNWAYDLYRERQSDPAWGVYQFTTLQGGNVKPEEVEEARRSMSQRVFNQEFMATFEQWAGLCVPNWSRDYLCDYNGHDRTLHIGMDFNVNPMSAVVFAQTKDGLHAIDEIVIPVSNTEEMVDEIKTRYPNKRIIVYPDPAGVQRKTSAGSKTDINILQNAGFECRFRRQHPYIRDRINSCNSLLLNSNGQNRLKVDGKCVHLIKSFEKLQYKDGTTQVDKSSGLDHIFDAATYCIEFLHPITKTQTTDNAEPSRWQVQTRVK